MYKAALFLFVNLVLFNYASAQRKLDIQLLKCLVCEATIEELDQIVEKIDPDKKVDVGGYRIDSQGNLQQKSVSQSKSETFLSEIIDNICEKMDDYVRATKKSNGALTVMKLIGPDGGMNPEATNVDFVQDDDLNKSLKYYCEGLLEEYEDNIIKHYVNNSDNIDIRVCSNEAGLCARTLPDPNDDYVHEEL